VNDYIRLVSHDETLDKRFKVLFPGYHEPIERTQNVRRTVGGELDVQEGSYQQLWQLTIKVRRIEADLDYGTKDDLRAFFMLRVYPLNRITLTDHLGNKAVVKLVGNFDPVPQLPTFESVEMFWLVPVTLMRVDAL
jgi:hypothetical protein